MGGKKNISRKILEGCDATINNLVKDSEKFQYEDSYDLLESNLLPLLRKKWNNAYIHYFGSRIMGLAVKNSDIDIFVEIDNNFHAVKDVSRDKKIICEIYEILKDEHGSWRVEVCIESANVPVIKAYFIPLNLKCDISVSYGLGVKNSLLIRHLFDIQPEAKKLYFFLKIFKSRYHKDAVNLDEALGSYLLKLLVIFYLQSKKFLPPIEVIQRNVEKEIINGMEVQFDECYKIDGCYQLMTDYKDHIAAFYQLYSKKMKKYKKEVISTHFGKIIPKANYPHRDDEPNNFLSVYGPINQKHNIGKYVSRDNVAMFVSVSANLKTLFRTGVFQVL